MQRGRAVPLAHHGTGLGPSKLFAQIDSRDQLNPGSIDKFATPLLIPPVMPRTSRIGAGGGSIDCYEIAVRQFSQQILPPNLPPTTVWGYGPARGRNGNAIFHAPSLTIEATHNTPVRINWANELMDDDGHYLPHLLAVDQTLHCRAR